MRSTALLLWCPKWLRVLHCILSKSKRLSVDTQVPCFDPSKDLVIPAWTARVGKDFSNSSSQRTDSRAKLFFFAGDLGTVADIPKSGPHSEHDYSHGIRQVNNRTHFAALPNKPN